MIPKFSVKKFFFRVIGKKPVKMASVTRDTTPEFMDTHLHTHQHTHTHMCTQYEGQRRTIITSVN